MVHVGLCRKDAIGVRRARRVFGARLVMQPKLDDPRALDRVCAAKPDLVVSWFWTKNIPRAIRDAAPLGAFGVHPSLLPRHRGPDPYFWAIARGDRVTGVTAHRLEDDYDTGAILGTRELAIGATWDAWTLARRLDRPSLALLRATARAFASDDPAARPRDVAQDETAATDAPAPSDDDLAIRWSATADEVVRLVRAASPWPGAITELGDAVLAITRAEIANAVPRALEPGEAAVVDGTVVVRARDAGVRLLAARREDREGPEDTDANTDAHTDDSDELLGAGDLAALLSQRARLP